MSAQTQFTDNFSDGNFSANPPWTVDRGVFSVSPDERLQLYDSAAGEAQIRASSIITDKAQWSFLVDFQFNPSSSNYAEVYLASDSADFKEAPNAVYVQLGGTTADRVSLYIRQAGIDTLLIESTAGWMGKSQNVLRIQVKRSSAHVWSLSADSTQAQGGYSVLGTALYNPIIYSKYTGVRCMYTVTRAQKMFFDDFYYTGTFVEDTLAPALRSFELLSNQRLKLVFDEALNPSIAEDLSNYSLHTSNIQVTDAEVDFLNRAVVFLEFSPPLMERINYRLDMYGLQDRYANQIRDTSVVFAHFKPDRGDIIINELLPDPTPVIGIPPNALPEGEYIELYNPQAFNINLIDWKLQVGSKLYSLGEKVLLPGGFLVVAREEVRASLGPDIPFSALPLSATALTNSGTVVRLLDPMGILVDQVIYRADWYGDAHKAQGGWSLERVDAGNLCGGAENWSASTHPIGGTPGRNNSVEGETTDTTSPRVARLSVSGDSVVFVHLSEWLEDPLLWDRFAYTISPDLNISHITVDRLASRLRVSLEESMREGVIYRLSYLGQSADCAGNPLFFEPKVFGVAPKAASGGLVLNEVLFNPISGGSDYVELWNRSAHLVDLEKLRLGNYGFGVGVLDEVVSVAEESYLLEPGAYICLSEDPLWVGETYALRDPEAVIKIKKMPAMPDDAGSIVLLNANLSLVDSLLYNVNLHSPVLLSMEGVSLERAAYTPNLHVEESWYSAANAEFGTPGYENSQQKSTLFTPKEKLELPYAVFSPNNDGYRDKLEIGCLFQKPNYNVSITLYNKEGYILKRLVDHQLVSTKSTFVWDGRNEGGQVLKRDAYLLVLEYFHPDGESGLEKQAVVLTY
jgi:hypothetical protein